MCYLKMIFLTEDQNNNMNTNKSTILCRGCLLVAIKSKIGFISYTFALVRGLKALRFRAAIWLFLDYREASSISKFYLFFSCDYSEPQSVRLFMFELSSNQVLSQSDIRSLKPIIILKITNDIVIVLMIRSMVHCKDYQNQQLI